MAFSADVMPTGAAQRTPMPARPVPAPAPQPDPATQLRVAQFQQVLNKQRFEQAVAQQHPANPLAAFAGMAAPAPTNVAFHSTVDPNGMDVSSFDQEKARIQQGSLAAGNQINDANNNAQSQFLQTLAGAHTYNAHAAAQLHQDTMNRLNAYRAAISPVQNDTVLASFGANPATQQIAGEQSQIGAAGDRVGAMESALNKSEDTAMQQRMQTGGDVTKAAQQERLLNEYKLLKQNDQQEAQAVQAALQAQAAARAAAAAGGGGGGGRGGRGGSGGSSGGGAGPGQDGGSGNSMEPGFDAGRYAMDARNAFFQANNMKLTPYSQHFYNEAAMRLAGGESAAQVAADMKRIGDTNRKLTKGTGVPYQSGYGSENLMQQYINQVGGAIYNARKKMVGG